MALSFPLPLATFFQPAVLTEATFDLQEAVETSGVTGGGEILTMTRGVRLWYGDCVIAPATYQDGDAIDAIIQTLREAGRTFLLSNKARSFPRGDPTGSILGASTPKISSIASNNRDLTIKSLPVGYPVGAGDFLSFLYGSSPTRYGYHKVVSGGVADGSGNLTVEVVPNVRGGAAANADITLIRAYLKAMIVPGSFSPGSYAKLIKDGMKFSWRQTLR